MSKRDTESNNQYVDIFGNNHLNDFFREEIDIYDTTSDDVDSSNTPKSTKSKKKKTNEIYGYCRISTPSQSIERQIRNIKKEFPSAIIFSEIYTGSDVLKREVWQKLYGILEEGDTVVFDSVSRMSRNAEEGYNLYQDLFNKGVELVFLKEPHINTSTYKKALQRKIELTGTTTDIILEAVNSFLMEIAKQQIRIAFDQAEKELMDIRQRTREGIKTARLHGKNIGQKPGAKLYVRKKEPIMKIIEEKSRDFDGHNSDDEVISIINGMIISIPNGKTGSTEVKAHISRNTFYKYKKELAKKREKQYQ